MLTNIGPGTYLSTAYRLVLISIRAYDDFRFNPISVRGGGRRIGPLKVLCAAHLLIDLISVILTDLYVDLDVDLSHILKLTLTCQS